MVYIKFEKENKMIKKKFHLKEFSEDKKKRVKIFFVFLTTWSKVKFLAIKFHSFVKNFIIKVIKVSTRIYGFSNND